MLSVSFICDLFKKKKKKEEMQKTQFCLQRQAEDHILAVPPSTFVAVTAAVCFASSVGSEERREERDELVWSD